MTTTTMNLSDRCTMCLCGDTESGRVGIETQAVFYIVEPTGRVNFSRRVCASCGMNHIVKVPGSSLVPLNFKLDDVQFCVLIEQALTLTNDELEHCGAGSAYLRAKAKREVRKRLTQLGVEL